VPLDFSSQIVKAPQVLSHLLLEVTTFSLPQPCGIRFPKSNRQIPTSPISSAFSGRYFSLPRSCAIRFPRPNPHKSYLICFYTGKGIQACDFGQMPRVEDPQVLSHLLLAVAVFPLPHSCVIRFPRSNPHKTYLICFYTGMGIQACDFAQMPRVEDPQVLSHLLLVVAIIPLPRPCATFDFPGQIVKSPQVLSHLLLVSGRYFSLAAPMCH